MRKRKERTDCTTQNDDADLQNKYLLNNLKSKENIYWSQASLLNVPNDIHSPPIGECVYERER